MKRILFLTAAVLVCSVANAQSDGDESPPFELARAQPGDGPLSVYLRLLDAEQNFPDGSASAGFVRQQLAQKAGGLGLHREALRWDGVAFGSRLDSVGVLPAGTRAMDAVDEIVRRSEGTRVVMINEAHHDATTRLLTIDLLEPLYERGFRYFAAETFAPDSVLSTLSGYPAVGMGYYTDEPVFGALVREALRLGYTLVPYEEEHEDAVEGDTLDNQQRRDLSQAQHLIERVFDRDPDARLLVHAGYGHVNESPTEYFSPMAWYFREQTGMNPLTISQTEIWAATEPRYQHPTYRAALEGGLLANRPVILMGADGEPIPVSSRDARVDLFVVRPSYDRPVEALGYGTLRSFDLPAACGSCLVEVRRSDEGPDAVPVDRIVVLEGGTIEMLGPRDVPLVVTVLEGETGRLLDRRVAVAR